MHELRARKRHEERNREGFGFMGGLFGTAHARERSGFKGQVEGLVEKVEEKVEDYMTERERKREERREEEGED